MDWNSQNDMNRKKSPEVHNEIRSVLDSIRRIVRALRVASRAAEKSVGISGAQVFVLQQLDAERALSVNELAERTFTHQSSVSEVVQRLVEKGLIERKQAPDDRRRVELTLTASGKSSLKKGPDATQRKMIEALEQMNAAERVQLATLLGKFVEEAGLAQEKPGLFLEEEQLKLGAATRTRTHTRGGSKRSTGAR
jgi:DNA-binding MarR family transcriptional regulator